MTVHFKWGRDRSLVWVTALDTGTPVADARVQISDSCTGELLAKGVTDRSGGLNVPAGLPDPETYGNCERESAPHPLIVTARHDRKSTRLNSRHKCAYRTQSYACKT